MKTTLNELRKFMRQEFKKMLVESGVDTERQRDYGYSTPDSGAGTEYGDLPEALEIEDVDRERREGMGYKGDGEETGGPDTAYSEAIQRLSEQPEPPPPTGASARKAAEFGRTLDPKAAQAKGMELVSMLMSQIGEDPQTWASFVRAAKKYHPQHPLAKLPSSLSPQPPQKEVNDPPGDEDKKKRVGKSHAAPSSGDHFPGPPAASEGFDPTAGRDPKTSEPFDKSMHTPIHNMSDPENAPDVPLIDLGDELADLEEALSETDPGYARPPRAFRKDPFWGKQTGSVAGTGPGSRPRGHGPGSDDPLPGMRSPPGGPPTGWADPNWEKRLERESELPKLSRVAEKDLPSKKKAKKMLKDKEVKGKPLTKKQKGLFGMIAGGEKPTKL
jgi:hypothetical protein